MTYKIKIQDIERRGGVKKLEREGHSNESIHKALYKLTEGMPQQQRTDVVNKLFDRRNEG